MGEVYRARDTKLARSVAIKVLNLGAGANAAAVRRFELEARAASALNHPGIVTIHDTGQSDGQFYIVMELVDGVTLRHMLRRGAPSLKKALHIAGQLGVALAKAHDAGVVHRDLKPENVMVTSEGHVKIVDFGLAKLSEPVGSPDKSGTESAQGVLLGTVGYMSPEQVRGETADFRADQFAFGAILYELATGARAFHRATAIETLAMILNEEPAPLSTVKPTLPLPIVWTIERCLSKAPADRYAATRDLAREMQTLLDHVGELLALDKPPLARERRASVLTAAALAIAVGGAAYVALQRTGASAVAEAPAFTQLTFGRGHVANARFRPDGRTILYAAGWGGAPIQVFETRPGGPESRPLGPPSASLASISSTGELALILGCRLDWANCVGTLARMPSGGGAPREILEDVVSADWAPGGQSLAAIQATAGEYRLHFPPGKTLYTTASKLGFLRFSPKGERLAFVEYQLVSDEEGVLKVIDLQGRATTVSTPWEEIRDIAWTPAGDEIWVSASERGRTSSIYAVSLLGARRLILHAPGALGLLDLARDGRALVTHGLARAHMVWSSATEERDISWLDWSTVADLSEDGKTILFYEWGQAVNARPVVYVRTADGSDAVRLGDGKALALSPDGRWALALQETPRPHLVLLRTGAGGLRELPSGGLTDFYWARWFPDGRRLLVVGAGADGVPGSYIQDTETGRLEPIAEKGLLAALVSPDGRRVLVNDPLEGYLVWPLDGGQAVALTTLDPRSRPIQWSADGQFLYVKGPEESVVRMHRFNIATGKSDLLKELAPQDPSGVVGVADGRGELAVTPDGKTYVFTYWSFLRDLFLVERLPQ
jgi:Tol biopolymer transport system component